MIGSFSEIEDSAVPCSEVLGLLLMVMAPVTFVLWKHGTAIKARERQGWGMGCITTIRKRETV